MSALDWRQLPIVNHLINRFALILDASQLRQSTLVTIVDLLPSVEVLNISCVLQVGTWTLMSLLAKSVQLTTIGTYYTSNTASHTIVAL